MIVDLSDLRNQLFEWRNAGWSHMRSALRNEWELKNGLFNHLH